MLLRNDLHVWLVNKRKRRRLCHVNMLKEYVEKSEEAKEKPVATVRSGCEVDDEDSQGDNVEIPQLKLKNSEVLANLPETLSYLPEALFAVHASVHELYIQSLNCTKSYCIRAVVKRLTDR